MRHPFAEHLALAVESSGEGRSRTALQIAPEHLNPHGVVHGAVLFALADTGMGAALYTRLAPGEACASIEVKINFLQPATTGRLSCESELVRRGRNVALLESKLKCGEDLLATASGHFAIFVRPQG
jgi:acyl-CoA thioesterase